MSININHETETITATSGTVTIAGTLAGSLPTSSYNYMKTHMSVNYSAPAFTVILPFDVADVDLHSNFNTTTHRFTPTVAGHYRFFLNIVFDGDTDNTSLSALIYRNGVIVAQGYWAQQFTPSGSSSIESISCETIELMNGSGDYVEYFISQSGFPTCTVYGATYNTIAIAHKL